MNIKEIPITKKDERGIIYNCNQLNFIQRKKGSINADHTHEDKEVLYLIKGEAELTVGKETKVVKAPLKIEIEPNQYHKLVALSEIFLLEDRKFE